MLKKSLWEQIKCRWREFRREPSAFFWVIFMPILWMVALGIAFSNPKPEVYGVGVVQGQIAEPIRNLLAQHKQIKLKSDRYEQLMLMFKRGEIVLALTQTEPQKIVFHFDPRNPESQRARLFVDDLIQRYLGRKDVVIVEDKELHTQGGRYIDFLIPGLLAFSILSSSLFGVGMTLVSNRKENLLKRYLATPMKKYEFLLSHVIGRLIVLLFEFTAIMSTGWLIFNFKVYGSMGAFLLVTLLGTAAFTSIGLFCASRTSSIPAMAAYINLITIPMMLLSGVFFSKSNYPDWMLGFIDILPLTALVDALRKIALEGSGLTSLTTELSLLTLYFVVTTIGAKLLFRWY